MKDKVPSSNAGARAAQARPLDRIMPIVYTVRFRDLWRFNAMHQLRSPAFQAFTVGTCALLTWFSVRGAAVQKKGYALQLALSSLYSRTYPWSRSSSHSMRLSCTRATTEMSSRSIVLSYGTTVYMKKLPLVDLYSHGPAFIES